VTDRRTDDPSAPDEPVLAASLPALRRSLRGLPDPLLGALAAGLERHGDALVAGRLFRAPSGGGCAVGVMLRELEPERFERGGLRFWVREGWRRRAGSYRRERYTTPRLRHLEWIFDRVAKELHDDAGLPRREAATAAGRWILLRARAELGWRSLADSLDEVAAPIAPGVAA
jgi:hypothetical protein